jgi:phenylacetaldehyde dehydrogenase
MGRGQERQDLRGRGSGDARNHRARPCGRQSRYRPCGEGGAEAFETGPWSRISPANRSKLVLKLGDLLEKHADEFAEIEALDNGKPVTNARRDDVGGSINMFRYMAGWSTRLVGETIPVSSPGNWHAYTLRQPVGVVGQIIPWTSRS